MIVCHCTCVTDHEIRAAVDWMRAADPDTIITPGKVYRALGKRPDCGGCMDLFLDTMRCCDSIGVAPPVLRNRLKTRNKEIPNEGRQEGHRIPKRSTAV